MGVDESIGDEPVNSFAPPTAASVGQARDASPRARRASSSAAVCRSEFASTEGASPRRRHSAALEDHGAASSTAADSSARRRALCFARGSDEGAPHADRRGAGPRRGSARQALRRPRRAAARPHARGDRARRDAFLHHQHRLLAPARQPHADARRDRGLRAVPRPADRACSSRKCWCCSAAPRPRASSASARASCGSAANG